MNVVYFVTDDQEIGTVDAQSMPWLAGRTDWVTFPNARIATPLCAPFRGTMFTGQRSDRNGAIDNSTGLAFDRDATIAVAAQAANVRTGMIGKYQNGFTTSSNVPPGWDWFFGVADGEQDYFYNTDVVVSRGGAPKTVESFGTSPADYFTDVIVGEVLDFLAADDGRPFMLLVPWTGPHVPSVPAPRHTAVTVTQTDPPDWDLLPGGDGPPAWQAAIPPMAGGEKNTTRNERADGRRCLLSIDEGMQQIVDALTAAGHHDTFLAFVTDNAVARGRRRIGADDAALQKRQPYHYCADPLMRVRWPGVAGRADPNYVSTLDISRTALAAVGAAPVAPMDGMDLSGLLTGTATAWRDGVTASYHGTNPTTIPRWWSLRTRTAELGEVNYVEWETGERELYLLDTDPYELTNVASAHDTTVFAAHIAQITADPHARDSALTLDGTPPPDVPVRPANLRAAAGDGAVALAWEDAALPALPGAGPPTVRIHTGRGVVDAPVRVVGPDGADLPVVSVTVG